MRFGTRDSSEFWRPFVSTTFPGNEAAVASGTSPTQKSQWWIQGRGPGALVPPLICRPNWGPKSQKKTFFETGPPRFLRVWMTATPHIWRSGSATDKHMGSLTKQLLWDGGNGFSTLFYKIRKPKRCQMSLQRQHFSPWGTVKRATNNVQVVLQHCCKMNWIAMLRVLLPRWKKNLETSFVARHVRTAVVKRWLHIFCCPF